MRLTSRMQTQRAYMLNLSCEQLAVLLNGAQPKADTLTQENVHPFEGNLCLFRCHMAGVHVGKLERQLPNGQFYITDSVRLWSWTAKNGISLSDVAVYGLKEAKVGAKTSLCLNGADVYEIIPCMVDCRE